MGKSRKQLPLMGLAIAAIFTAGVQASEAATLTFDNAIFTSGAGLGTVPLVLVIQADPSETASVYWDGTEDVTTGDSKPQSRTWSVSSLADIGITGSDPTFGLVLNINESGSGDNQSIDLLALRLDFFDGSGAWLFSAPYTCLGCAFPTPLTLQEAGQGTGSSGFLFSVTLTPAERNQFFGTPSNRLGLFASIGNSDAGQETFYLADLTTTLPQDPPSVVPEPASMLLVGTGLAALAARRWMRVGA
jgi:hypothetical protein